MPKAEQKLKADLVIENASELCTVASRGTGKEKGLPLPLVGRSAGDIGVIKNGFVAAARGKIIAVGSKAILKKIDARDAVVFNATGKTVLPGFVDCHTHLVFAGSRENELEQKALGASYFEILKRGGGILSTVRSTRRASKQELVRLAGKTLDRMLSFGTTTVEAKSGYGLDLKTELKILQATRELREKRKHAVDVVPTFLGAHAVPPGFASAEFADEVIRMLPSVRRFCEYCDVFCEKGESVFSVGESRKILRAAAAVGLKARIHADEFSQNGGAELAAEVGAASADHLLHASAEGIRRMARKRVTAVLLPATSFSSMLPFADGRAFFKAGVPVALATDFNPNCLTESMPFVIALACRYNKMTPAQAVSAATLNAAFSLGRANEIGSIEVGKKADLIVLDAPNHKFLPYHFGVNLVETVFKAGVEKK
jgi:imidazolonepropionase